MLVHRQCEPIEPFCLSLQKRPADIVQRAPAATDGSELAEHAVTNGVSLAKLVGAKVTVISVEDPEPSWLPFAEHGALEELGKYKEQLKIYAANTLNRAADAAKQAGVPCETRFR